MIALHSWQEYLSSPVGAVNDRYTCCAYQAIAKSMPDYCSVFDFSADYLFNFCKTNDYQNFGPANYDPAPPSGSSPDSGGDYIQLGDATLVHAGFDGSWSSNSGGNGVFRRGKVIGDFRSTDEAAGAGLTAIYRLTVISESGRREVYFVDPSETIEIPMEEKGGPGGSGSVRAPLSSIDLALDTAGEEVVDVIVKKMPIGCKQPNQECSSDADCCSQICRGDGRCAASL